MKRNPTLAEKKQLIRIGIHPEDWLIRKHSTSSVTLQHKHTGRLKIVPKSLMK